jgi:hypothetical protein
MSLCPRSLVTDTLYQERHREQEREEKDQERKKIIAECDPAPRGARERVEGGEESRAEENSPTCRRTGPKYLLI